MTKHTDTSRSGDLVERLREKIVDTLLAGLPYNRDGYEAADRIEALEAENERLWEALGDLIEAVQRRTADLGGYDGRFGLNKSITKARAALGEKQ